MPRDLLPPDDFYRVSVSVMHAPELPTPVRETYAVLRGYAWAGYETPDLPWGMITRATGKDRQSIYRHLLTLVNTGVTRWRTAGVGHIRLTFTDGIGGAENCLNFEMSQKREMPLSSGSDKDLKNKTKREPRLKIETSQKRDKPPKVDYFPLAQALAQACRMDLGGNRGKLFAEAKRLSVAQPTPTPELIQQHYNGHADCYWRKIDWRGKKGDDPNPATIRETWGKWLQNGKAAAPNMSDPEVAARMNAELNKNRKPREIPQ